jgi:thiol-disulfide isomerase/thioredoxin
MSRVNEKAPELTVDSWLQGEPSNIAQEKGKVVLIEVFQVNCPGCFMHGFPEVIEIYNKYQGQPLVVWGLATAFEDFDKNNLANLTTLLKSGEVIGETLEAMNRSAMLNDNRLEYPTSFPVAWDKLIKNTADISPENIQKIIHRDIGEFDSLPEKTREMITQQVKTYLQSKIYSAQTFEAYELRGTPSSILIDKNGILRHSLFGSGQGLEEKIKILLNE